MAARHWRNYLEDVFVVTAWGIVGVENVHRGPDKILAGADLPAASVSAQVERITGASQNPREYTRAVEVDVTLADTSYANLGELSAQYEEAAYLLEDTLAAAAPGVRLVRLERTRLEHNRDTDRDLHAVSMTYLVELEHGQSPRGPD